MAHAQWAAQAMGGTRAARAMGGTRDEQAQRAGHALATQWRIRVAAAAGPNARAKATKRDVVQRARRAWRVARGGAARGRRFRATALVTLLSRSVGRVVPRESAWRRGASVAMATAVRGHDARSVARWTCARRGGRNTGGLSVVRL